EFAAETAGEIERTADANVLGVRCSAGKIELPRCRGGRRHLAEEIGAIAGPQRRGGEDVEDAGVGKVPIAPGEKTRVIRLEAGAAQHAIADRVAMQQQHAAVPQRRQLAPAPSKMPVDLLTSRVRELPRPRL